MRKFIFILLLLPALMFAEVQFSVGGAARLHLIPSIMGVNVKTIVNTETNQTSVGFGINIEVPVTVAYVLDNEWALGGSLLVGFGVVGGPTVAFKAYEIEVPVTDWSVSFLSFNAMLNFMAKTPTISELKILFEAGASFRPGEYNDYFKNVSTFKIQKFYTGPGIFVGIEKLLFDDNVSLVVGGRISAELCVDPRYVIAVETSSIINFGIECRVSFYTVF